ncbi:hypothetical protein roselon_03345 [Roseibacterium elongatum DSM 19469]|uniref:Uncharacterized protein n=1 Tax=Roseicyclus elongatus DSM 19469 TaxID=1294273 RepID=W8RWA6_9RHOB|nr:hypothetical protein [Roseibacterium elongatum]AHM05603.1 hypothetical protein roselon_03345 [Roseibacterium elongatum DSM 19469]
MHTVAPWPAGHVTELLRGRHLSVARASYLTGEPGKTRMADMAPIGLTLLNDEVEDTGPLWPALAALPRGRAVTIMTHGYRYSPRPPETDPHTHILSFHPRRDCWKVVSWPRHLHLHRDGAGLGVALGWQALGQMPRVARRARRVGHALAPLIAEIHHRRPDLRINLMGHSLGARVILAAMTAAPAGSVARVILLTGAEYRTAARAAMNAPAGRTAEVLNVTSGENAPFDALFRLAAPPLRPHDRTLCAGVPGTAGWTDLRIDRAKVRAVMGDLGFRLRPPNTHICHWSGYLRPGLFPLYRRVLAPEDQGLLAELSARLAAARIARPSSGLTWPIPRAAPRPRPSTGERRTLFPPAIAG